VSCRKYLYESNESYYYEYYNKFIKTKVKHCSVLKTDWFSLNDYDVLTISGIANSSLYHLQ